MTDPKRITIQTQGEILNDSLLRRMRLIRANLEVDDDDDVDVDVEMHIRLKSSRRYSKWRRISEILLGGVNTIPLEEEGT
jgi:hypothetical protein